MVADEIVGCRFTYCRNSHSTEQVRLGHHAAEQAADLRAFPHQIISLAPSQITTVGCRIEPVPCFLLFSIGVGEFAHEMLLVASLRPRLGDLCADRSRRSANLIGQRIHLLPGKVLRQSKYLRRQLSRLLIDQEIAETLSMTQLIHPVPPAQ